MSYQLSIIGPGRVGTSMGTALAKSGACIINQIVVRDLVRGKIKQQFLGARQCIDDMTKLEPCDIILVTTPDDAIESVAAQLSKITLRHKTIILHCSGLLSSEILTPLSKKNALIASVHPLFSFSQEHDPTSCFKDIPCAIEGDAMAVEVLKKLFSGIQANVIPIDIQDKGKWHLAAVMACNGLNALLSSALSLYKDIGVSEAEALKLMSPILTQTINQILKCGPTESLTGPIERGDKETIAKHLKIMPKLAPEQKDLYCTLSRVLIKISNSKGNASKESLAQIESLLL